MHLAAVKHPAPCDVVFIHGAGGNNLLWRETLQALTGRGNAFAVNLPGHPSGDILCKTISEYAEAVFGFISESGRKQVVCGHSMGGAIALTLTLDHPGGISGLVLVGSGAKLGVLPAMISGLERNPLETLEKVITPMSFHRIDVEMGRRARVALSLSNPDVFLNDYLACSSFDVRDRLKEISVPTLIMCGEDDRMTPPRWSEYLHLNITSSRAPIFVKDSGHMLPIEKPAECGRLIQEFLRELSR